MFFITERVYIMLAIENFLNSLRDGGLGALNFALELRLVQLQGALHTHHELVSGGQIEKDEDFEKWMETEIRKVSSMYDAAKELLEEVVGV